MTNQQGAPEALAHELFTAAQLAPGEGISDAVARIAALVEAQQPAPSEQQPFGWIKQSEIDSSNAFGGSINLWRQKYDCDVPVYLAQQPAPSAAANWKLVPEGPTPDMVRAGWELLPSATGGRWDAGAVLARSIYSAMLAAAPQPSPTPQADSQPAPVRDYPPLPKPDCPNIWGGAYSKNQMCAYADETYALRIGAKHA